MSSLRWKEHRLVTKRSETSLTVLSALGLDSFSSAIPLWPYKVRLYTCETSYGCQLQYCSFFLFILSSSLLSLSLHYVFTSKTVHRSSHRVWLPVATIYRVNVAWANCLGICPRPSVTTCPGEAVSKETVRRLKRVCRNCLKHFFKPWLVWIRSVGVGEDVLWFCSGTPVNESLTAWFELSVNIHYGGG